METADFQQLVYGHFREHGRILPWRTTTDPYRILVSEVMLQQTQVERVLPKYEAFLERLPTVAMLAAAPLAEVLALWQGLGYNRRGMLLHRAANVVMNDHAGQIPRDPAQIARLPGIGTYTAGAVAAFAFGRATAFIETNIRSVYLHHFFADSRDVHDRDILPLVERTMDRNNIRDWYNALMDYGATLKKQVPNPSRRSRQHSRQSPFRGSNREIRGELLRLLLAEPGQTAASLVGKSGKESGRLAAMLAALVDEGLLREEGGCYRVA